MRYQIVLQYILLTVFLLVQLKSSPSDSVPKTQNHEIAASTSAVSNNF
jgi:hypothetical protein